MVPLKIHIAENQALFFVIKVHNNMTPLNFYLYNGAPREDNNQMSANQLAIAHEHASGFKVFWSFTNEHPFEGPDCNGEFEPG